MAMEKPNFTWQNSDNQDLRYSEVYVPSLSNSSHKRNYQGDNLGTFKFVWKSRKDKIKRKTLISDYKNGGLRMPHIVTLIKTQRIMCMKKYFDSYNSTWKVFLDNYLSEFGGSFLLKCNCDIKFLPKTL